MRCDVCILFIRSSLILFECPAKIPRSSLRSFSLWARHSAETSAELNVRLGAAEFLPVASRQVRRVRKRRRKEMRGRRSERLGSRVGTRYKPAIRRLRRTAVRWGPQFSSSAPPRSPAPPFDHFPFGPRPRLLLRSLSQSEKYIILSRLNQVGASGQYSVTSGVQCYSQCNQTLGMVMCVE